MESYKIIKVETLAKVGMKASQEKLLRKQIIDSIPKIDDIIDKVWHKKDVIQVANKKPYYMIYFVNNEPCFVQPKDGPIIPHIKLLHKFPFLLPTCQIDKGGIKHVITGANIMIPGMTSKGGRLPPNEEIPHNIVAVLCEDKTHAIAIGQMQMSAKEMEETGKGIGIEVLTYIGDEAWNVK